MEKLISHCNPLDNLESSGSKIVMNGTIVWRDMCGPFLEGAGLLPMHRDLRLA